MAKYVYIATFLSSSGKFDEFRDTARMNDILHHLQERKAGILSVQPALGGQTGAVSAVYLITYEAEVPVEF